MISIDTLDDARVAPYLDVAQPDRLRARGLFVVEGRLIVPRLLAASTGAGRWAGCIESVLVSPAAAVQLRTSFESAPVVPVYVAPQAVMSGLVGFNIHRGCLAMARRPAALDPDGPAVRDAALAVVLEGVNNPDNIGGIFRSAAAFGADVVVLGPGCADPLYRKSIRTSMGATLAVPFVTAPEWPHMLDRLRAIGMQVTALTIAASAGPLGAFVPSRRAALLAGAEGGGLSTEALTRADHRVRIPMAAGTDSLNVATAVSIALYHVAGASHRP